MAINWLAVFLINFVDGADVRMAQGRSSLSFAPESIKRLRIARDIIRQKLQCYEPVKPGVLSFINDAHSSATELFDDAVVGNRAAEDGWGISHFVCILRPLPDRCR